MSESTIRLQELARSAGISADQAKYWARLLKLHPVIRGRVGYITDADAALFSEMVRLVGEGGSPKEVANNLTGSVPVVPVQPPQKVDSEIATSIAEMKAAIMAMADQMGQLVAENRRLSGQVEVLSKEAAATRALLLPPTDPTRQIQVWRPEPKPDPLAGASWLQRLWIKAVAPDRMRRWDS